MMSYPLPPVPELGTVLQALHRNGVETHLRGYLYEKDFPFVDVCHIAAAKLFGGEPPGFRFIYPFPVSSQACIDGQPDPLQGECRELAMALQDKRPNGYDEALYQRCFTGLVEQAEYVTRFTPSRLVMVQGTTGPDEITLRRWMQRL